VGPNEHPARKLKFLLQQLGVTTRQLAAQIGIDHESLKEILDEKEIPPPNILNRICAQYHLNPSFFKESLDVKPATIGREAAEHGSEGNEEEDPASKGRKSRRNIIPSDLVARQRAFSDVMVAKKTRGENERK
jgi:transcriptional regulator with XRE-family HTH domain